MSAPQAPPRPTARLAGAQPSATHGPDIPRNPLRALVSSAFWYGCAHLATDAFVGILGLTVLSMLVTAVCLLPIGLVGIPIMVGAGHGLLRLGAVERARFAATCGITIPPPRHPDQSGSPRQALTALARDPTTWREISYFVVLLPLSIVTSVGVVLAWAVPLALIPLPLYYSHLPFARAELGPLTVDLLPAALLVCGAALLVGLLGSPLLIRALVRLDVGVARLLLTAPRQDELAQQVERLTHSRARVVDAAEAERQRIERDLHDGAQQRLVAMSMTLGRARSRLKKSGDDRTLELVDEASREVQQAIAEIRDLTRGLHPPVLTDRGLDAALSAVAARSPVPVTVDVQLSPRPPIAVEAIAYFVVVELLTNVAKHANAAEASVTIRRNGDRMTIRVRDDGGGGVDPSLGSGLTGVADRISGVDGQLRVDSPLGGPTVIEVDMRCEL